MFFLTGCHDIGIKTVLTQRLVFTADVSLVLQPFQCVEQVSVVQLSGAVRLVPTGNLSHLNMT